MKKLTMSLLSSLVTIQEFAQHGHTPNSYVDFGIGVGPNYGIVGGRAIIGWKGTGLLVGVGSFDGFLTNTIGFQFSYNAVFISVASGAYGSYAVVAFGQRDKGLLEGTICMTGARFNLTENKRTFLELGIGYAGGDSTPSPIGPAEKEEGIAFTLGLNVRLGK